ADRLGVAGGSYGGYMTNWIIGHTDRFKAAVSQRGISNLITASGDGKPDINIDTDGDGKPDINIDTDGDGKPDINIDIDGDGKPD
ncbi:prolyl oligopeptidase family serine peptidase, partial [Clostridioides difficile]